MLQHITSCKLHAAFCKQVNEADQILKEHLRRPKDFLVSQSVATPGVVRQVVACILKSTIGSLRDISKALQISLEG